MKLLRERWIEQPDRVIMLTLRQSPCMPGQMEFRAHVVSGRPLTELEWAELGCYAGEQLARGVEFDEIEFDV